jgi:IS5 family transposase
LLLRAATLIAAPSSTENASGERDCEMHQSKKGNHWYFGMRPKVEHACRVINRQFGHVKVRYRGLKKNTAQLSTLFALSNLWMVRKTLQVLDGQIRAQPAKAA